MTSLSGAIWAEWLKARRSRVPWGIAAAFSLAPLVGGLFMLILKDPAAARRLGLIGAKAQITAGSADWPTYLNLLGQAIAIGAAVLFAFLTAWVFGREFSDKTVRNLLAIPTPRSATVVAKALVVVASGSAISAWVVILGLVIGGLVNIPGWSSSLALEAVGRMVIASILTLGLQSLTAFFAGIGHGYIPALGWAFFTVFAAQVMAALGWGAVFPWAVPAILVGAGGGEETVSVAAVIGAVAVSVVGLVLTVRWWDRADHVG